MEVLSIKSLTGGSSSSDAKFVGNVTNGGSFPTTRLDGSALKEGDYVRPKTGSTFPFIIGSVTFTSTRDKAIYSTAGWMIDPGALQDTVETPVKDKSVESLSGNASTQYAINSENKEAINKRVVKDTSGADIVYSRINNVDSNQGINKSAVANTVAWRGDNGTLKVGNATDNLHAVNKQTMQTALGDKIDKINTTVSLEHAVVKKADGTYNLMQINSANNAANAIVRRDNDKQINVPLVPASDEDAASKKYVDDNKTVVDSAISSTSTNPVQNKVIKAALDDEATARSNADTTIQNNLTSEISNRQNADLTLQNNIDSEATARANADNTEATTRSNADTTLQNNIDNEALARSNAIDNEALARSNKDTDLQDQINNLSTIGRYLSTWNAATGKPTTEPETMPYTYKSGDYYIINGVGVTNYKPNGSQYTGAASTTVETETIANNGFYQYDGATWIYLAHAAKDATFSTLGGSPYENTNLKNALDAKASVSSLNTHTSNTTVHVTSADKSNWNSKASQSDLDAHANNEDVHVNVMQKVHWSSKQDTMSGSNTISVSDNTISVKDKSITLGKISDDNIGTSILDDPVATRLATNQAVYQFAKTDGETIEHDATDGIRLKNPENYFMTAGGNLEGSIIYNGDEYVLAKSTKNDAFYYILAGTEIDNSSYILMSGNSFNNGRVEIVARDKNGNAADFRVETTKVSFDGKRLLDTSDLEFVSGALTSMTRSSIWSKRTSFQEKKNHCAFGPVKFNTGTSESPQGIEVDDSNYSVDVYVLDKSEDGWGCIIATNEYGRYICNVGVGGAGHSGEFSKWEKFATEESLFLKEHPVGSRYLQLQGMPSPNTLGGSWVIDTNYNGKCLWIDSTLSAGTTITQELPKPTVVSSFSGTEVVATASGYHDHTFTGSSTTTGTQSASHTHSGTTASSGAHTHSETYGAAWKEGSSGNIPSYRDKGNEKSFSNDESGSHTHTFTTGNQSANHTHTLTPKGTISMIGNHSHLVTAEGTVSSAVNTDGTYGTGDKVQPDAITCVMWKRMA